MNLSPGSTTLRSLSLPLLLVLGLATSACDVGADCEVGIERHRAELLFGLDRTNAAPVSEAEWQNFVDTSVKSRFKDNVTTFAANGQYTMADGSVVQGNSKVLVLLHDGSDTQTKNIDTIRDEYTQRFSQKSVLRIDTITCVDF
jgi:hypothetical protein